MARWNEYERLTSPFPMVRLIQRHLEHGYEGPVFIWDVDKTYLDTRFSQARHLIRIPFELAIDKRAIPGTVRLLHGLREGPGGREHRPLFFVTASPPQLRRAIEAKMLLDGIEYDGITYKDQFKVIAGGAFDQVREQVAFKLSALLLLYRDMPPGARIFLFGDDAERDAFIYSLFADVTAGRMRGRVLHDTLLVAGARHEHAERIRSFAESLPERETVRRIYINLVRHKDGSSIADFSPQVVGYPTAVAAARDLIEQELLVPRVLEALRGKIEWADPLFGRREPDPAGFWTPRKHLVL